MASLLLDFWWPNLLLMGNIRPIKDSSRLLVALYTSVWSPRTLILSREKISIQLNILPKETYRGSKLSQLLEAAPSVK